MFVPPTYHLKMLAKKLKAKEGCSLSSAQARVARSFHYQDWNDYITKCKSAEQVALYNLEEITHDLPDFMTIHALERLITSNGPYIDSSQSSIELDKALDSMVKIFARISKIITSCEPSSIAIEKAAFLMTTWFSTDSYHERINWHELGLTWALHIGSTQPLLCAMSFFGLNCLPMKNFWQSLDKNIIEDLHRGISDVNTFHERFGDDVPFFSHRHFFRKFINHPDAFQTVLTEPEITDNNTVLCLINEPRANDMESERFIINGPHHEGLLTSMIYSLDKHLGLIPPIKCKNHLHEHLVMENKWMEDIRAFDSPMLITSLSIDSKSPTLDYIIGAAHKEYGKHRLLMIHFKGNWYQTEARGYTIFDEDIFELIGIVF